MNIPTLWQLRYRSPLSPTKGVDDVVISTDKDSEDDAKALADWWLETKMPSPSTRFIYVRRLVVATSAVMRAAQGPQPVAAAAEDEAGPNPAQSASRDTTTPPAATSDGSEEATTRGRGPRSAVTPGRIGT